MCVPLSLVCAKPRLAGSILCFTQTAVMFDKTDYHYTFGQLATIELHYKKFLVNKIICTILISC